MLILRYLLGLISTAILFAGLFLGIALDCARSAEPQPASAFRIKAEAASDGGLRLVWSIAPGSYLYKDKIRVTGAGDRDIAVSLPEGENKDDPNFGPTDVYHDGLTVTLPRAALQGEEAVRVGYQGCADRLCYPPERVSVDLRSLRIVPVKAGLGGGEATAVAAKPPVAPYSLDGDWFSLAFAFLGFGLLLALTPCVLPMVPILMGMLSRSAGTLSPWQGLGLSSVYVLAMAGAYGLLGVGAAWSGQNLQVALQTPIALSAMAVVFAALALASFGLFELRLPALMTDRLSGLGGERFGRVAGAAILGFSSALIVGPCVTPPLAAALIYVAQTGDMARGAYALFALGLGMGLPLLVAGTLGPRFLPRSGPWLLLANRVFGVVFLAIAVALLGRVVPPAVAMLMWAGLAVGSGVFLGAFDPIIASSGPAARLRKSAGLLGVIYGGALVIGAAAGGADPLRPLDFVAARQAAGPLANAPTIVRDTAGLDAALSGARGEARPVVVEFSADWCTSCRTMEREVFSDPRVREKLRSFRVIRADLSQAGEGSSGLMRRFEVVGPPTIVFLNPQTGQEIADARSTGEITADEFHRTLARLDI